MIEITKLSGTVQGYQYMLVNSGSTSGYTYKLTDPKGASVFAKCTTDEEAQQLTSDMSKINLCFLDIEVETTGKFPRASVAAYPINCVTIYFSKTDNYITYGVAKDVSQEVKDEMAKDNGRYVLCKTEGELLTRLFTEIGNNNVSILSGWNFTYDTTYMVNRAAKLKIPLKLMSRLPAAEKRAWVDQREGDLHIAGTEVIDFLDLYRKYTFSEQPSYKLDYIGEITVGEHKAPLPEGPPSNNARSISTPRNSSAKPISKMSFGVSFFIFSSPYSFF